MIQWAKGANEKVSHKEIVIVNQCLRKHELHKYNRIYSFRGLKKYSSNTHVCARNFVRFEDYGVEPAINDALKVLTV